MTTDETRLLRFLQQRCFRRGEFRLASGAVSDYYIDGRMAEVFSESAHLIGEVLYERTKDLGLDALGGLAVGAVPLTTAAVINYHLHGRAMEGFWVRDRAKDHGTRKLVEGNVKPGARVAIVEDVVTTGGSALKAIEEVRQFGCEVAVVVCLVDRLRGAEKAFKEAGAAAYQAVFTIRDFGVEVDAPGPSQSGR